MESEPDADQEELSEDACNPKEVSVIELVQFTEPYESLPRTFTVQEESDSFTVESVRGKYYKQTYRTAWESMPDFKGWLRGVEGQPTRAFCMYCQKTLHAHRLSLLKHTCTLRHQKAAQIHSTRKNRVMSRHPDGNASRSNLKDDSKTVEAVVEFAEMEDGDVVEEAEQEEVEEDEEGLIGMETLPVQFQKQFQQHAAPMSSTKPPISTHVLDMSKGTAVSGLQVSLYKLIEGRWTYINEGVTNLDGRFANFLERSDFVTGRYKLHYDVDRFFEARRQDTLYPFIEIVFDCKMPHDHYHIPLLLSPFGYTTYKGT